MSVQPVQASAAEYRQKFSLPAAGRADAWGVNLGHFPLEPLDLVLLRELGVKWVRRDFSWSVIEPERQRYDFSRYDQDLQQYRKLGIRPIFILSYGNDLYGAGSPRTASQIEAFVQYVRQGVRRYQRQGVVWEMWNEPNITFWKPRPNVTEYIALNRAVGEMMRKEFPGEWYVGPAVSEVDLPFIESCLVGGTAKYWDALTVHPYRTMEPETAGQDLARLRAMLVQYGLRTLPVWSGEWGYSAAERHFSESVQARYAVRQLLSNASSGASMSVWYNWRDAAENRADYESNFGLVQYGFRPRNAYRAIKEALSSLNGHRFKARLADANPNHVWHVFQRGERPTVVGYSKVGNRTATLIGQKFELTELPLYFRPERRNPTLDLLMALPTIYETTVFQDRSEVIKLLRSVVQSLPKTQPVELDMAIPVLGRKRIVVSGQDAELESKLQRFTVYLPHGNDSFPLTIGLPGPNKVSIVTQLLSVRAFDLVRLPASVDRIDLAVISQRGTIEGAVKLVSTEPIPNLPLSLKSGQKQEFQFPKKAADNAYLSIEENGRSLWLAPIPELVKMETGSSTWGIEGAEKVTGNVDSRPMDSDKGFVLECAFEFGLGWKYGLAIGGTTPEIPDGTHSLGMWVHGDGSGVKLSYRYLDESGETYQPRHVTIDFIGWQYVQLPLRGQDVGYWGGDGNGVPNGRLRLTQPYVLDNPGGAGVKGMVKLGAIYASIQKEKRLE
ncbi:MAG: beta-galactosidase [Fimbriimonadaceae bacterium]|nr:beta-galactosidase [Fimbriimonadaceae bacterium]